MGEVLFRLTHSSEEFINVNFRKGEKYNWRDVFLPEETIWETLAQMGWGGKCSNQEWDAFLPEDASCCCEKLVAEAGDSSRTKRKGMSTVGSHYEKTGDDTGG
jgi:hypothetical protein